LFGARKAFFENDAIIDRAMVEATCDQLKNRLTSQQQATAHLMPPKPRHAYRR
jgi:hypothetical protein